MPIHQPVQTIIHTCDFRDKAYCFDVESVLTARERTSMLTISVSPGYLLSTSLNNEFKREQAFEHIQQADSSWIAKGTITLIITADSPIDGTVIIRNSVAETFVLAIEATTSLALLQQPALTISEPVLSFSQTSRNKPSFAVLTIAQQHSEAPVTLSTDAPEYFQLASDSRPAFLPTLTLIPSRIGTYVHIRYSATKAGFHSSQLTIQNSFEKRTVILEGRSSGLLPTIRTHPLITRQLQPLRLPNRLSVPKRWVGVLSFVIMIGLIYAGYSNRCQLFPALCHAPEASQSNGQTGRLLPALAHDNIASKKVVVRSIVSEPVRRKEANPPAAELVSSPSRSSVTVSEKQPVPDAAGQERRVEANVPEPSGQQQPTKKGINQPNERQSVEQITPPVSTDESDLERTLNQKPNPL